ncbi:hypothetical protein [Dissulfuribacter thermophilus]|uniref:hypothetical protein n=1 Tax=Dissulfuribacter thermophilus TaxID=1156395 RepID=UPI000835CE4A|nr:hypothetical protein [Dissulfuribacter thermophilus]
MNKAVYSAIFIFFLSLLISNVSFGQELKTRYATIRYSDDDLLREFNKRLYLGRRLGYLLRNRPLVTVSDEVSAKVDIIVEKVEAVLDMFPQYVHFSLVLLPSSKDVQQVYYQKYGRRAKHIAYYSLSEKTIYLSVRDCNLRVLSHEIGHMVVDHYFKVRPPYRIHEVLAQYAEKHVTD